MIIHFFNDLTLTNYDRVGRGEVWRRRGNIRIRVSMCLRWNARILSTRRTTPPLRPQRERRLPRAGRGTAARAYDLGLVYISGQAGGDFQHMVSLTTTKFPGIFLEIRALAPGKFLEISHVPLAQASTG